MSVPIVVVLYPSLGSLLAVTALSRCFATPPQVYFFEEVDSKVVKMETEVVVLDYLITQANDTQVGPILDCVHSLQALGGHVLELSRENEANGFSPGMNAVLSCIFRENRCREDLHGYDYVLARLPGTPKAVDSVGQRLLADANAVDNCDESPSLAVVNCAALCDALHDADSFRAALADMLSHCDSSLVQ